MVGYATVSTIPDPRPRTQRRADGALELLGARCTSCGYRMLVHPPRCARCFGTMADATFPASGTVWSSTVVRIPVPGRTPPYALAYVDIDDGPRVLAHIVGADDRPAVGSRVVLAEPTPDGDLAMELLS